MTNLLIRLFIKKPKDAAQERLRYGVLAGSVGIACNLLLCAAKFYIGILSGSIAVRADAVNNLSDMAGNIVTLIGFKAAGKPADKEHPYGHARVEYIAALVMAFFILLVGFELGKESVLKIILPSPVEFSLVSMAALALSIAGKLWLGRFTACVGERIQSETMRAATADSLCDAASTGAILLGSAAAYFFHINLDGHIGVLTAGFVLYSGVGILRDTISPLMGEAPEPALIKALSAALMRYEGIEGLHDIMVHSYGPGRVIASAHAEVRADANIVDIHEVIDRAEREVGETLGLLLTLHLDPVETDDALTAKVREHVCEVLRAIDPTLRFHDFRMVTGDKQTNLIFDIVVPPGLSSAEIGRIKSAIREGMWRVDASYCCVIDVDMDFCGVL
ncbi:MAG: cation diffusion facilitator family transporter [Christensenellaceae bacterium]|jgi:cation diffusion facilitator family transporter|nr:cation diffusion facilitator family transporter [Christensenellaceae bacterium]